MPNNPQMQGNPLAELAARWRPVFAQPGRQYHHLAALRSFRRTRSGARFRVASDDGTAAHLAITFVHPQVIIHVPPPYRERGLESDAPAASMARRPDGLLSVRLTLPQRALFTVFFDG